MDRKRQTAITTLCEETNETLDRIRTYAPNARASLGRDRKTGAPVLMFDIGSTLDEDDRDALATHTAELKKHLGEGHAGISISPQGNLIPPER